MSTLIPDEVLAAIGEQVAAAKHDWDAADPSDVGLNGVIIKQWREGYFEGCKDIAHTVVARLPKGQQKEAGERITASFMAEAKKLKEVTLAPSPAYREGGDK